MCNCHFLYLSVGHLKTKKSYNPIIFVNLIYGHFDILRSQYGLVKKSGAFQVCAKIVLRHHTANGENPKHIRAHPISINTTQIPSDTSQTSLSQPRQPQTPPMKLETPTDANRHRQTYSNSTRQCLGVSEAGFLCLLVSVVVCWHIWFPEMSGRCLG